MEDLQQRDCYAVFGPSHRRRARSQTSSSINSSYNGTEASQVFGNRSSKATSISLAFPEYQDKRLQQVVTNEYTYRHQTEKGHIRHNSSTNIPQPKRMSGAITLENYARQLNELVGPPDECNGQDATYAPHQIYHPRAGPNYRSNELEADYSINAAEEVNCVQLSGLRDLLSCTKKLLGSCCLLDFRLPNSPIVVSTNDNIFRHVNSEVRRYASADSAESRWWVQTVLHSTPHRLYLVLSRTVVDRSNQQPVFAMVARVDITELAAPDGFAEHLDDVWLHVAADEMRAQLRAKPHLHGHIPETVFLHAPARLRPAVRRVVALYDSFFVIEAIPSTGGYGVSYVARARTVAASQQLQRIATSVNDGQYKLARRLAQGDRFLFDARLVAKGPHEIVWCLPVGGMGLKCWICFILESVA